MRFKVLNDKKVEIISDERMLKMFGEISEAAKASNGILYISSREYRKKKAQLEKIEPKGRLTRKMIAEGVYRDVIHLERCYHTLWNELSLRNIENY